MCVFLIDLLRYSSCRPIGMEWRRRQGPPALASSVLIVTMAG